MHAVTRVVDHAGKVGVSRPARKGNIKPSAANKGLSTFRPHHPTSFLSYENERATT